MPTLRGSTVDQLTFVALQVVLEFDRMSFNQAAKLFRSLAECVEEMHRRSLGPPAAPSEPQSDSRAAVDDTSAPEWPRDTETPNSTPIGLTISQYRAMVTRQLEGRGRLSTGLAGPLGHAAGDDGKRHYAEYLYAKYAGNFTVAHAKLHRFFDLQSRKVLIHQP